MQLLKPIKDNPRAYKPIEEIILNFLVVNFYQPLYKVIEPIEEYYNSVESEQVIIKALRSGKIQFVNGKFVGDFTAEISKALRELGAKFNKVTKTYNIARSSLSMNVKEAIAYAALLSTTIHKLFLEALDHLTIEQAMPELKQLLDVPLDTVFEDLTLEAYISLKDSISIVPEITQEQRQVLKDQYYENVELSVKNFTEKQTKKLRAMAEENLLTGLANNKSLVKSIIDEFGVTERKAQFLARNETGLFSATYKMTLLKEAGIKRYKWSTSHDERVRKFHKDLDGQIIEWDNPPIINDKGDRKHAGFDYQCRCEMMPILDMI